MAEIDQRYIVGLLGSRMNYAVPKILHSQNKLEIFFSDFFVSGFFHILISWFSRLWNIPDLKRTLSRSSVEISRSNVRSFYLFGLWYVYRRRTEKRNMKRVYLLAGERFCKRVCKANWKNANATYTFNSAGLEIMEQAKNRGMFTVMEQTIAPFCVEKNLIAKANRDAGILNHEAGYETQSYQDFVNRERKEWELADVIICGSQFVVDGIGQAGGPVEKCKVVPYGISQPVRDVKIRRHIDLEGRKLRILMVGHAGIRKGTYYLCEASEQLQYVAEILVAGPIGLPSELEAKYRNLIGMLGSLPRQDIDALYEWADIFVLPSICEGSATVVYEALAFGLPCIVTPNAGSVVCHEQNGLIIEPYSSLAITAAVKRFLDEPELYNRCTQNAIETSKDYDLEHYKERLLAVLLGE